MAESGEVQTPDNQMIDHNPGTLQDLDGTEQNNEGQSNKKTQHFNQRKKKTDESGLIKVEKKSAEQSTETDKSEPINNKRVPAPRTKIVISPTGKTSEKTSSKADDNSASLPENEPAPNKAPVPTKTTDSADSHPKEAAPAVIAEEKPVSVKAPPVVAQKEKPIQVNKPKPVARSPNVVQGAKENAVVRDVKPQKKENVVDVAKMDPTPKLNLNPMAVEFVPTKTAKPKAVPGGAVPAPRKPLSPTHTSINHPEQEQQKCSNTTFYT